MIITTAKGKSFDTDRDLSAPERHILQNYLPGNQWPKA